MVRFSGKVLFLGCGSVAQCAIPLFIKHIEMPIQNITVLDFVDNRERIQSHIEKGMHYVVDKVTKENYAHVFKRFLGPGDLLIDLAWNIDTCALLDFCHKNGILYINTAVEVWDPYQEELIREPRKLTLYWRQMAMQKLLSTWKEKNSVTSVIDHGANPGLVSHFAKQALLEIGEKILKEKPLDPRRKHLERALSDKKFAELAYLTGLKVIHISERDTQITREPKQVNEFVNTWSVEGFIEEGIAPAELGWGTHEHYLPKGAFFQPEGPKNQIYLSSKGMNTWVRSWVPSGEIKGMVIRHGESYSLSDFLTYREENRVKYRPTVHYAYCPCDAAINSMHELEMRQYEPQSKHRILSDDIISGKDELGCLLMGHDFGSWWIGSILDIQEARKLVPGQNATTIQVAISVVAACIWMIRHPMEGFSQPEKIDHEELLKIAKPYLGQYLSSPVEWTPMNRKKGNWDDAYWHIAPQDQWQFTSFLTSHREKEAIDSPAIQPVVQAF